MAEAGLCLQLGVSTSRTQVSRVPLPNVKGLGGVSAVEMRCAEFSSRDTAHGAGAWRAVSGPSSPGRDGDKDSLPPQLQLTLHTSPRMLALKEAAACGGGLGGGADK